MKKKKIYKEPMLGTKKQRFEVLLEDIDSNVKLLAEQSTGNTQRFDIIDAKLSDHDKRFDTVDIKTVSIEMRLTKIEEDTSTIKLDIEFIKNELKQKIDRKEFSALERRLSLLENKFAAAL